MKLNMKPIISFSKLQMRSINYGILKKDALSRLLRDEGLIKRASLRDASLGFRRVIAADASWAHHYALNVLLSLEKFYIFISKIKG
jgi:hypothetical protein